eukprot:84823-Rhodomonas_salina.1
MVPYALQSFALPVRLPVLAEAVYLWAGGCTVRSTVRVSRNLEICWISSTGRAQRGQWRQHPFEGMSSKL